MLNFVDTKDEQTDVITKLSYEIYLSKKQVLDYYVEHK